MPWLQFMHHMHHVGLYFLAVCICQLVCCLVHCTSRTT